MFRIFLVFNIIVIYICIGFLFYKSNTAVELQAGNKVVNNTQYVDSCGENCKKAIVSELAKLPTPTAVIFPTLIPTEKVSPTKVANLKKVKKEEIFTLIGNGSTIANDWTDINGTNFYFDTRDYPGILEVYFEANINLVNGNGLAYVRLYDVTNNIAVNGSENNTNSQLGVWTKSQKVYFWAGKNLIRVQAKSLTADTTVFNQGRLRIVVEN